MFSTLKEKLSSLILFLIGFLIIFTSVVIITVEEEKYREFEVGLICSEQIMYIFQVEILDSDLPIEEITMIQDKFKNDIDCNFFMLETDRLTFVQTWFYTRFGNKFKVSWAN